jgi:hypothetical protein
MNKRIEYKDYPKLPDWLIDHIYKILDEQSSSPITYDDNFKDRMLEEAEMWMGGADEKTLEAIAVLEFNEDDTLGKPFTDPTAYEPFKDSLARFDFIPVDKIVEDWVSENIPEKVIGVNLQVMHSGSIITPHVDELRHYALNYTLERGGDCVQTVFYKAKSEYQHQKAYARTLIPFEKLEVVESIGIPINQWHKMNISDDIHAVLNLDPLQKRIALSCSIVR